MADVDQNAVSEQSSYNDRFDPVAYLHERYDPENASTIKKEFPLQQLHELFKAPVHCCPGKMKILDYGCGPVPLYSISAAARASEVVFAEYTENNRHALRRWVERDPNAYNWSPYFDYIVQTLEGGSEKEARGRDVQSGEGGRPL